MPKAVLIYRVEVEDDDEETITIYLQKMQECFKIISEDLAGFGFTEDQTISSSDIRVNLD
jgi:hypothetical protein